VANHADFDIEIIDLRTLAPLDMDTIFNSVRKTGRAIVLHEDCLTGGIGGEISARITESCFSHLDAPVFRCASLDTPVPFNAQLEINFLAQSRLHETVERIMKY
jgi:2-oxoisovalerate dehydrogenase E1 component